jgi:hypothetical protein
MPEALAKPSQGSLLVTYDGSSTSGNTSTLALLSIDVIGIKLQMQADIQDVTAGADTVRRLAKTNLSQGRLLVTGYMTAASSLALATCISEDSGTGKAIVITYGQGSSGNKTYTMNGFVESVELNANKTQPYVGVAVSFRISGAVT